MRFYHTTNARGEFNCRACNFGIIKIQDANYTGVGQFENGRRFIKKDNKQNVIEARCKSKADSNMRHDLPDLGSIN